MLVTVCIPFCFEREFLIGSLNQIFKHRHEEIDYEIILCDQAEPHLSKEISDLYGDNKEIKIIKIPRIDAGYPIDIAARMAKGEYFCSLDADAFPVSNKWLWLPIKLIEKYGFSFIGKTSHLHQSYPHIGEFSHINNYYRISKTEIARKCSENIGFIRPQNKSKSGLSFVDESKNYWSSPTDNGVMAQWYADKEKLGPKLSLSLTKVLGRLSIGLYGMVIDDLVFHMVFGQTIEENHSKRFSSDYINLLNRIKTEGLTDSIIEYMLNSCSREKIIDEGFVPHLRRDIYWGPDLGGTKLEDDFSYEIKKGDDVYEYIEYLKNK